jgi:hypothetical protein
MIHRIRSVVQEGMNFWYAIGFLALIAAGCSHGSGSGTVPLQIEKFVFHRVAVAPFQQSTPEMVDINAVDCSSCGVFSQPGRFPDHPERMIERNFIEKLNGSYQIEIIPSDRVSGIYERYANILGRETPVAVLKKVGADLGADGIAYGYVYYYRERKGLPYAVEKPASVAFEIHLFRVSDGALLWKGRFDKTQSSLMEDVLQASAFFRGGGRWLTARELAEEGIEDVVKTFPAVSK